MAASGLRKPLLAASQASPAEEVGGQAAKPWASVVKKATIGTAVRAGKGKGGKDFGQSIQSYDFDVFESFVSAGASGICLGPAQARLTFEAVEMRGWARAPPRLWCQCQRK